MKPSLELVCINYVNFMDAAKAVEHCVKVFPSFKCASIIHPNPSEKQLLGIEINNVGVFVMKAQSQSQHLCCLKEMPKYLTCDFALSIQWDGFIVRPDLWDDRFFDYDYIAPPWPIQNIVNPLHRVGSGGFCMFSKRFAQYWAEHGDPEIPNDWERGAVNRQKYEDAGFTFAPVELAARFGKEHEIEDMKIEENESFGFHDLRINKEYREKYRSLVYGKQ